jgi:hypothetical protein
MQVILENTKKNRFFVWAVARVRIHPHSLTGTKEPQKDYPGWIFFLQPQEKYLTIICKGGTRSLNCLLCYNESYCSILFKIFNRRIVIWVLILKLKTQK